MGAEHATGGLVQQLLTDGCGSSSSCPEQWAEPRRTPRRVPGSPASHLARPAPVRAGGLAAGQPGRTVRATRAAVSERQQLAWTRPPAELPVHAAAVSAGTEQVMPLRRALPLVHA